MPEKKSNRKSTSKSKSSGRKTRRSSSRKKAKFTIPLNQVVTLCLVIVVACTAIILINALSSNSNGDSAKDITDERKTEIVQKSPVKQPVEKIVKKSNSKDSSSSKTVSEKPAVEKAASEKSVSKSAFDSVTKEKAGSTVKTASDIPDFKNAVNGAKLVFIFDDGGQNLSQLEKFLKLPFPITVAVLPRLAYSSEAGKRVRESGNELMLHQPMQAVNLSVNPGKGAITPDMSLEDIDETLRVNIGEIGPVSGLNNHEGSLITEDEIRIGEVMRYASEKNIYFLDSRTTTQTRVAQAAMSLGLSYYERNIFLDNQKTRENVLQEIAKGIDKANEKGSVIMIGHVWSADFLPAILEELYPVLKAKGYVFTTVSRSGALITP